MLLEEILGSLIRAVVALRPEPTMGIAFTMLGGVSDGGRAGIVSGTAVEGELDGDPRSRLGWPDRALRRLLDLRRGPGAWGYRGTSSPAAEPTTLAALALLADPAQSGDEGRAVANASARWLATTRRPDGSVAAAAGLPEAGWPTAFASLLWSNLGGFEAERSGAVRWLLGFEGRSIPRVADDPMGHDPSIVGWPWVAGTHSWVEPTAMAMLALAREGQGGHPRLLEGFRLLIDRAIPTGGWNLGNPVVFGTILRPLPGPTGLALLALATLGNRLEAIDQAIAYLRPALAETLAPVSLGWGLLGLRAWGVEVPETEQWLAAAYQKLEARGPKPVELAMLLLASGSRSLDVLGIAPSRVDGHRSRSRFSGKSEAHKTFLANQGKEPSHA
jgi:hypothetical protein